MWSYSNAYSCVYTCQVLSHWCYYCIVSVTLTFFLCFCHYHFMVNEDDYNNKLWVISAIPATRVNFLFKLQLQYYTYYSLHIPESIGVYHVQISLGKWCFCPFFRGAIEQTLVSLHEVPRATETPQRVNFKLKGWKTFAYGVRGLRSCSYGDFTPSPKSELSKSPQIPWQCIGC